MNAIELIDRVSRTSVVRELVDYIGEARTLRVEGVAGSLLSFLVCEYAMHGGAVQVVMLRDRDAAGYFYNDCYNIMEACAGGGAGGGAGGAVGNVLLFPTSRRRTAVSHAAEPAGLVQRTAVLSALSGQALSLSSAHGSAGAGLIICTYPDAMAEKVVSPVGFKKLVLPLAVGDRVSIEFVEQTIAEFGFRRVDFVSAPGEYSLRGGILDLFSYTESFPFRVDFFGDSVESIRAFAVSSQLSNERFSRIEVVPDVTNSSNDPSRQTVSLVEYVNAVVGDLGNNGTDGPGDTGQGCVMWFDNAAYCLARVDEIRVKILREAPGDTSGTTSSSSSAKDAVEAVDSRITSSAQIMEATARWGWVVQNDCELRVSDRKIDFGTRPQGSFNKKFELLLDDIRVNALDQGITTYILTRNKEQVERLENIFASLLVGDSGDNSVGWGSVPLTLSAGFVAPEWGMALYTDHQIFDRYLRYKVHNEIDRGDSLTLQEISALRVGDYVVHVDHGVGRFGGLVRSREGGQDKEFIKLMYRDNDVLFVGLHSLHRISKYKDKDAPEPRINKLGSGAWQKLKATTKSKVKDIARELIALYAARMSKHGFAFSEDTYMQTELEASFLYEDTPDQHSTTQAIKRDMESEVPMDRLVCGDVGFGKTEIAMRAAFKAVADGKQVAVLVPTTVLSLQHYRTFSRRLREFPVTIENFSRVKTASQVSEILGRLRAGQIDIIIGTHKLLGKNVEFKDLGLLVVDEEQKFGVAGKEKLRHLKANVDTLTLTATPIPRTLQFSLMGARDMSIINTPPPNRQSVTTEVLPYDEAVIAEAVQAELDRGGQVFFLHNRVENIAAVAATVRRLVPQARVVVGHGQMAASELERVMMDFIYGEYDVLVATTIIESGIDIPNANTIIINNAQNFGLSDLHQLRGRVGRTNRKAYCYLLIPSFDALSSDAQRRLKAIEDFSELGSGFNIAMQDLDIRGAGNILGAEQSGFIADIGYQTYQRIMAEAVAEIRQEQGVEVSDDHSSEFGGGFGGLLIDCVVDTDRAAYFPDSYIGSTSEKIRLYRALDNIVSQGELDLFRAQLTDRFGEPPAQALELFEVILLRRVAQAVGFDKVTLNKRVATLYFAAPAQAPFYAGAAFQRILQRVIAEPRRFSIKDSGTKLSITIFRILSIGELRELIEGFSAGDEGTAV